MGGMNSGIFLKGILGYQLMGRTTIGCPIKWWRKSLAHGESYVFN
jgi:hypothetical protein